MGDMIEHKGGTFFVEWSGDQVVEGDILSWCEEEEEGPVLYSWGWRGKWANFQNGEMNQSGLAKLRCYNKHPHPNLNCQIIKATLLLILQAQRETMKKEGNSIDYRIFCNLSPYLMRSLSQNNFQRLCCNGGRQTSVSHWQLNALAGITLVPPWLLSIIHWLKLFL